MEYCVLGALFITAILGILGLVGKGGGGGPTRPDDKYPWEE